MDAMLTTLGARCGNRALALTFALATVLCAVTFGLGAKSASAAVVSVDVANGAGCYVTNDGEVFCWGREIRPQLGSSLSFAQIRTTPTQVRSLTDVTKVSVDGDVACAVDGGAAKCWGANHGGVLGDESTDPSKLPVDVHGLDSGVTDISVSADFACAVASGALKCWGTANGLPTSITAGDPAHPLLAHTVTGMETGVTRVELDHGAQKICVLKSGAVQCAGQKSWLNSPSGNDFSTVTGGEADVTDISGNGLSCAIKEGRNWCWGSNELGQATPNSTAGPAQPTGLGSGIIDTDGRCAVTAAGAVMCFGSNLGNGDTASSNVPVASLITSGATAIASDGWVGCAVVAGELKCWGSRTSLELPDGSANYSTSAQQTQADAAAPITVGPQTACAVLAAAFNCWGRAESINGSAGVVGPTAIPGLGGTPEQAAIDQDGGCAVVGGAAKCWGYGAFSEDGQNIGTSTTATPVPGLESGTTRIARGAFRGCAVQDGAVKCWSSSSFPTTQFPTGATDVALSDSHTGTWDACAVVSGAVKCWKFYTNGPPASPQTTVAANATAVGLGARFGCAIVGGGVQCWGANEDGQLGNGTLEPSEQPTGVTGLDAGVTAISVRGASACALQSGAVKCWGANDKGQLGNGSLDPSSVPQTVVGAASAATALALDPNAGCAAVAGALRCWGASPIGVPDAPSAFQTIPTAAAVGRGPTPEIEILYPEQDLLTNETTLEPVIAVIEDSATVECSFDARAFQPCDDAGPELADGQHTLRVRATEPDGNTRSESVTFEIDASPPEIYADYPYEGWETTSHYPAFYVGWSEDLQAFDCVYDGEPLAECYDLYELPYSELGQHTLVMTAVDLAGNATTVAVNFSVVVPSSGTVPPPIVPPSTPRPPFVRPVMPKAIATKVGSPRNSGRKRKYPVTVSFDSIAGSACEGDVRVGLTVGRAERSADGTTVLNGARCSATLRVAVPRGWKKKRAKLLVSFGGNTKFKPFESRKTIKLK